MRQAVPFGKYLLLDRISVGGMAEVFKAKSYGVEGFEKVIAIKRILPSMGEDREFIKMFIDEAKIAGQLTHANICQIFELGRTDGAHFIAMEYIWGKDLLQIQNRLRKLKRPLPVATACFILAKVCEGLDYAHRKRDAMGRPLEIVHRDCSPQNLLISYEGEVKLIDFGIAKAASRSTHTMSGVLKGKFGYMSPEQVRGLPLDRRSDIFALGTVLYESVTGERLFQGETDFAILEKVRNVDIVPPRQVNSSIPVEVEAVILKALARDADDRYSWCSEMLADLQAFLRRQESMVTSKTLSAWLKELFAPDIERERQQLESYKRIGRDGLIAGVPAASARLDVVEHFGPAGSADGPTAIGGPSFDDVVNDSAPVGPAPGSPAARGRGGTDFTEEAPTSIFGEIAGTDEARARIEIPAAAAPVAPSVLVKHPTGSMPVLPASLPRPTPLPRRAPTPTPVAAPMATPIPPPLGSQAPSRPSVPPPPPGAPSWPTPTPRAWGPAAPPPGAHRERPLPPVPPGPPAPSPGAQGSQPPANANNNRTLIGMTAPPVPVSSGPAPVPGRPSSGAMPAAPSVPGPPSIPGPPSMPAPPQAPVLAPSPPPQPPAAPPAGAYSYPPSGAFAPPPGYPASGPIVPVGPSPQAQVAALNGYAFGSGAMPAYAGVPVPLYAEGGEHTGVVPPGGLAPPQKRRHSLGKDVAIGVGIAALVLAVVAVVRFVILVEDDSPPQGPAVTGGVVVITGDDRRADVYVDGQLRGTAEAGRLEVAELGAGDHHLRVVRDGALPCDRSINLAAGQVETVRCELVVVPPAAPAPVEVPPVTVPAITVDAAVVDRARAEPPAPPPAPGAEVSDEVANDVANDGVKIREDEPDEPSAAPPLRPSKPAEARATPRPAPAAAASTAAPASPAPAPAAGAPTAPAPSGAGAPTAPAPSGAGAPAPSAAAAPAAAVGYLVAYTTPFARVLVDGADSGKSTPIAPNRRLELAPGKHTITFQIGEEQETFSVSITAGKTTRLNKDLRIGRGP